MGTSNFGKPKTSDGTLFTIMDENEFIWSDTRDNIDSEMKRLEKENNNFNYFKDDDYKIKKRNETSIGVLVSYVEIDASKYIKLKDPKNIHNIEIDEDFFSKKEDGTIEANFCFIETIVLKTSSGYYEGFILDFDTYVAADGLDMDEEEYDEDFDYSVYLDELLYSIDEEYFDLDEEGLKKFISDEVSAKILELKEKVEKEVYSIKGRGERRIKLPQS